jgi:hypothetical protein
MDPRVALTDSKNFNSPSSWRNTVKLKGRDLSVAGSIFFFFRIDVMSLSFIIVAITHAITREEIKNTILVFRDRCDVAPKELIVFYDAFKGKD